VKSEINPSTWEAQHQTAMFFEGGVSDNSFERMGRMKESLNGDNIKADLFTVINNKVYKGLCSGDGAGEHFEDVARHFAAETGYNVYTVMRQCAPKGSTANPTPPIPVGEMVDGLKALIESGEMDPSWSYLADKESNGD
jgi:hypothetical protein